LTLEVKRGTLYSCEVGSPRRARSPCRSKFAINSG
jgi:hypothetical protein